MPNRTWAYTPWGAGPDDTGKLTRRERAEREKRRREDYKIGLTSIAIGSATVNEDSLTAIGLRHMFSEGPDGVRGLEEAVEEVERLAEGLPIDIPEIERRLIDAWDAAEDRVKDRMEKRRKLKRMDHRQNTPVLIRLRISASQDCHRAIYRSEFPTPRRVNRGSIWVMGLNRGEAGAYTITKPEEGTSQCLRIDPAFLELRREVDVYRYGPAKLVLGWADVTGEPGAMIVLVTGPTVFDKRLVIGTDVRGRIGKPPKLRVIRNVPYYGEK
jgi:hypothetical protein